VDCSTCRSLFSESFDGRLSGDRRQGFIHHVQACKPCDSEYALYRRVFSAVRGLPDEAAPPFRVPAEVPGALSTAHRFGRPRFARVAAAVLIMIGLAGTHVLVFQWSRDHAIRSKSSEPASQVRQEVIPSAPLATVASISPLPAALRDHVDATDSFIRTAARLPDDASGREFARADWAATDLTRRTSELRKMSLSPAVAAENRAIIVQYLEDMEQDFIPQMRFFIEDNGGRTISVRAIRDAALQSSLIWRQDLERMKILVAALPRGTSFSGTSGVAVQGLGADGRLFLEAKHARLAGEFQRAIAGFQRFESEFQKSSLRPAAQYLEFETLATANRLADALNVAGRASCQCAGGAPEMLRAAEWVRLIPLQAELRLPNGFDRPLDHQMTMNGFVIYGRIPPPLKSEGRAPIRVLEEEPESRSAPK